MFKNVLGLLSVAAIVLLVLPVLAYDRTTPPLSLQSSADVTVAAGGDSVQNSGTALDRFGHRLGNVGHDVSNRLSSARQGFDRWFTQGSSVGKSTGTAAGSAAGSIAGALGGN